MVREERIAKDENERNEALKTQGEGHEIVVKSANRLALGSRRRGIDVVVFVSA